MKFVILSVLAVVLLAGCALYMEAGAPRQQPDSKLVNGLHANPPPKAPARPVYRVRRIHELEDLLP